MLNKCKCGKEPALEVTIECSMSRWQVICECGRVSDTFISPKNAEWHWNSQNPNHEEELKKKIDSKVHAQNFLNSTFGQPTGEMLDELLGDYKITDKGELALENQKNSDKATYWFEKHNEAQEELDDLKVDLKTAIESYEYWQKKWREEAEQNEKLNMLIGKIKEVVE